MWIRALFATAVVVSANACAHAPPSPPGPLRGPGLQGAAGIHYSFAPAKLEASPQGETWTGNAGGIGGGPVPHRLGARVAATHWFDLGYDISFRDMGADLRFGASEHLSSVPWALSLGGRTGTWGPIREQELALLTYEVRARAEAYPVFSRSDTAEFGGIFSLGVSFGKRYGAIDTGEHDSFVASGPEFVWKDARLEATLGLRSDKLDVERPLGVQYGVMPYLPLTDSTLVDCRNCTTEAGARLEQDFGVVFVVNVWFFTPFSHQD